MSIQGPLPGEMVQLTEYEDPCSFIKSQHGTTNWRRYLELEKERIEKSPGRTAIIKHGRASAGNKYALFVNNVGSLLS